MKKFLVQWRIRRLQRRRLYLLDKLLAVKNRLSDDPLGMALNEIEIEDIEDKVKAIDEELTRLQPINR